MKKFKMIANAEIKKIDRFEVIPVSISINPKKRKRLVELLAIPGSEHTVFAASFVVDGQPNLGGFIAQLVCPTYTRTKEEREKAEKAYRKIVDSYFLQQGYTIKDKRLFFDF